jgi:hypothetical protein
MVLGSRDIHPLDRFLKGFARFPPKVMAYVHQSDTIFGRA